MALLPWENSNLFSVLRDKFNAIVNLLNSRGLVPKNVYLPYDGNIGDTTLWDSESKGVIGSEVEGYALALGQTFVYNSVTYNMPNLTQKFLMGADGGDGFPVGSFGGDSRVTLTAKQSGMRRHFHEEAVKAVGGSGGLANFTSTGGTELRLATGFPIGVDGVDGRDATSVDGLPALESHNNIPPYYAVHYIKRFI